MYVVLSSDLTGITLEIIAGKYGPEKSPHLDTFHAVDSTHNQKSIYFLKFYGILWSTAETYSEPCRNSKIECFAKIVNS